MALIRRPTRPDTVLLWAQGFLHRGENERQSENFGGGGGGAPAIPILNRKFSHCRIFSPRTEASEICFLFVLFIQTFKIRR